MSIPIYQDTENINPSFPHGKRNKGDANDTDRTEIPKPSKRVALGTISHNGGCNRIQPSRAAKGKHHTLTHSNNVLHDINIKPGFVIFDESEVQKKIYPNCNPMLLPSNENLCQKDSPMILSPALCNTSSFEEIQSGLDVSSTIEDIDLRADVLFGMPEYASDIHLYLKRAELKFRPKQNYMRKQVDINCNMRAILVDWLVEVAEEYKLKSQTIYLTVNYIDRFLSYMSVLRGKLQLVGAACMLIAAKFEEIYPPEVKEFVDITDDTYTSSQILRMEHLILKTLAFNLSVPTCKDFISRYLVAADAILESQLHFLSEYLCELVIIDIEASVKYLPSMVAASAVCLANITLNLSTWSLALQFYSEYKLPDITPCIKDVYSIYKNASKHPQQAVQLKYKTSKFGFVSEVIAPDNLNVLDQFG